MLRDIVGSTGMFVINTVKWYYIFKFIFWYPIKFTVLMTVNMVILGYKMVYWMMPLMWKMTVLMVKVSYWFIKGIYGFIKFIISLF